MFTTLLASLIMAPPALSCPVMGSPVRAGQPITDFNGARFTYCCAGCDAAFAKDPLKYLKDTKGKTVGEFLFDPVSRTRIVPKNAAGGYTDYNGLRFYFKSAANKSAFDNAPARYAVMQKKEVLRCPVSQEEMKSYVDAWAYQDVDGVRYYICCQSCVPTLAANPGGFVKNVANNVKAPKAISMSAEDAAKAKTGACGDH